MSGEDVVNRLKGQMAAEARLGGVSNEAPVVASKPINPWRRHLPISKRSRLLCAGRWLCFTGKPRLPRLRQHVDLAGQHFRIPPCAITLANERQIQLRIADAEPMERHVWKPMRELGIHVETVGRRVCLNTKNR